MPEEVRALINNGRAAMWSGDLGFDTVPSDAFEVGMVPMPVGPGSVSDPGVVHALVISAQAAPAAARACSKWFTFLSGQPTAVMGLPARRSLLESVAYRQQVGEELTALYAVIAARVERPATGLRLREHPLAFSLSAWAYKAIKEGGDAAVALREAQRKADLEQAPIALQRAQAAYDAISWRSDIGATPEAAALQQATIAFQRAQAAYDLAVQAIDTWRYDLQILQQQVALAELQLKQLEEGGVDPRLQRAVALARLEVERLEAEIGEARIVAPFAGKIVALSAYPGQAVEAFQPVIILAHPTELEVSADLSPEQMSELSEGQPVTVVPVNYPGQELLSTIRRLPYPYGSGGGTQALAEADRSTRIRVDFAGLPVEVSLAAGDLGRVRVVLERREDVLWLPPAAIRTFGGRTFVIVQERQRQRRVDVTVGVEGEERVEIRSGLEEGEVVVGQ